MVMQYKYVTENNLENIQTYMYSEFVGIDFINAYLECRNMYLDKYYRGCYDTCDINRIMFASESSRILYEILKKIDESDEIVKKKADVFVKRFEVKKRIYREYDNKGKAILTSGYDDYAAYLLLGFITVEIYKKSDCMKYLLFIKDCRHTFIHFQ